jgi:hypothetical protein
MQATRSTKSIPLEQVETIISDAITGSGFENWENKRDYDKLISISTAFTLLSLELEKYNKNLDRIQQKNPNPETFYVSTSTALINTVKREYNELENRVKFIRFTEVNTENDLSLGAIETFMKTYQPEIAALDTEKKARSLTTPSKPCMAATIVVIGLVSAIALNQFFGI